MGCQSTIGLTLIYSNVQKYLGRRLVRYFGGFPQGFEVNLSTTT